jgi:hypothetical protein
LFDVTEIHTTGFTVLDETRRPPVRLIRRGGLVWSK